MINLRDLTGVIIAIVLIILSVSYSLVLRSTVEQHEITVKDKRIKYKDDNAKYLISDTDGNVYSVEDSIWFLTFDASNRYAKLQIGKSYIVTTVGWRIPLLSMYKNIIKISE